MSYENEYHRASQNPMGYNDLDRGAVSTRGILITLGVIALLVLGIVAYSSVNPASIDTGLTGSTTVPTTTAPANETPTQPYQ